MAQELTAARVRIIAKDETAKGIKSARRNLDGMGKAIKGIGGALAGLGAGAAFTKLISGTANALDDLGKLSKRTNIAVESLQGLQFASGQAGVEFSRVSNAFTLGAKNISEASEGVGEAKDEIEALGLNAKELAGLSIDDQFRAIVNGLAGVKNQTDKTRIATAIFGRTGAEVLKFGDQLPALEQEFESLGATISGESVAAAEDFKDSLGRLKTVAFGTSSEFTANLLPSLTKAANFMARTLPDGINLVVKGFKRMVQVLQLAAAGLFTIAIRLVEIKRLGFELANYEAFQFVGDYAYTLLGAQEFKAKIEKDLEELEALRDGFFERSRGLFDPLDPFGGGDKGGDKGGNNKPIKEAESLFKSISKTTKNTSKNLREMSVVLLEVPRELREWEKVSIDVANGMANSLQDFLFDPAEKGIKGFAKSFLDTIRQIAARLATIKILQTIFKGTSFAQFIPKFAQGGQAPVGTPYLVGERGPELRIDQTPGRIIPNNKIGSYGGGSPTFVTTLNIEAGADPGFLQRLPAILDEHRRETIAAVFDARTRGRAPA